MLFKPDIGCSSFHLNFAVHKFIPESAAQRFALPALGRGRRSRPARKMLRRRKMLEMCADSPASGARFVSVPDIWKTRRPKIRTQPFTDLILHAPQIFTSPTLFWKMRLTYQNARAKDLPKPLLKTDFAKNTICREK
jgi:hypothetical protein